MKIAPHIKDLLVFIAIALEAVAVIAACALCFKTGAEGDPFYFFVGMLLAVPAAAALIAWIIRYFIKTK